MTVTVNALTDVVSPATPSELAELLGVDATDPLLQPMLEAATDAAETWLNSAIVSRQFEAYWPCWPVTGAITAGLSPQSATADCYVELPYTRLVTVDAVTVAGDAYSAYETRRTNPARLLPYPVAGELSVTYTAGWDLADVPSAIKQGVLMAAAFLYEHRGSCDADAALQRSGAAGIMKRYKIELGY